MRQSSGVKAALALILEKKNMDVLEHHISINSREARSNFAKIVGSARVNKNIFVITEHGEPAAAIVSIDDLKILDWIRNQKISETITTAASQDLTFEEFKHKVEAERQSKKSPQTETIDGVP